jgi:nicotinic acid mononucleotide adenylyltransferase
VYVLARGEKDTEELKELMNNDFIIESDALKEVSSTIIRNDMKNNIYSSDLLNIEVSNYLKEIKF